MNHGEDLAYMKRKLRRLIFHNHLDPRGSHPSACSPELHGKHTVPSHEITRDGATHKYA